MGWVKLSEVGEFGNFGCTGYTCILTEEGSSTISSLLIDQRNAGNALPDIFWPMGHFHYGVILLQLPESLSFFLFAC